MYSTKTVMKLFALAMLIYSATSANDFVKVAAFNIQVLGRTKMSKPEVVDSLIKILNQFDMVFIQEIRDLSGEAIVQLLNVTNLKRPAEDQFQMILGPRAGRTSSKEQYAYFYREIIFDVTGSFTYDDGEEKTNFEEEWLDTFQREPLCVLFKIKVNDYDFWTCGIHTDPGEAEKEINSLVDVHQVAANTFNQQNGIIMGDLNADCSYFTDSEKAESPMAEANSNGTYQGHIQDNQDTTTYSTHCAYDRFVIVGPLQNFCSNATVYRFDTILELKESEAKEVSDHYPIVIQISTAAQEVTSTPTADKTTEQMQSKINSSSLKIAAFNLNTFGQTKAGKPEVVAILVQIINQYDITLVQEIRDSTGTAISQLLNQINIGIATDDKFGMVLGPRVGRTSAKEQYAYIYRIVVVGDELKSRTNGAAVYTFDSILELTYTQAKSVSDRYPVYINIEP